MKTRRALRRGARGSVQPSVEANQRAPSDVESSDDDDDDDIPARIIPSVSPTKPIPASHTCPPVNQAKRSLSEASQGDIVLYPGSKRQRNGYNLALAGRERGLSFQLHPGTLSKPNNSGSSTDDDVAEGLINSVNDAFHRRRAKQTSQGQEVLAIWPLNDPKSADLVDHEMDLEDQDSRLPPPDPSSLVKLDSLNGLIRRGEIPRPITHIETTLGNTLLGTQGGGELKAPTGVENADLPPARKRGRPRKNPKLEPEKKKLGRPRKLYPAQIQDDTNSNIPTAQHVELSTEDDIVDKQSIVSSRQSLTQHFGNRGADFDIAKSDGTLSPLIDGFNSDTDTSNDIPHPTPGTFEHDVESFNTREVLLTESDIIFRGPLEDNISAIYIDHQPLRELCEYLGGESCEISQDTFQWHHFDHEPPKTEPARALQLIVAKLVRLYEAAPRAPNLESQNQFLKQHADMLSYYYYAIDKIVEVLPTLLLAISERGEALDNTERGKRQNLREDLVLHVIPILASVMASAWGLGGTMWLEMSFTSTAVQLLKRGLDWIVKLHHFLPCEPQQSHIEETEEQNECCASDEHNVRREEMAILLDEVSQVITVAANKLVEMEAQTKEEPRRRRKHSEIGKKPMTEQKVVDLAEQVAAAERKGEFSLPNRGIHDRPASPAAPARQSPSSSLILDDWSIEEQKVLFLHIQSSFPVCPDLDELRWELNKTIEQMVAMTEHLLGKMLAIVLVDNPIEEQVARVRQVMDTWEDRGQ